MFGQVKLLLGYSDGRCDETQIEVGFKHYLTQIEKDFSPKTLMMQVQEAEECDCLCNADGLVSLENIFPTFFKRCSGEARRAGAMCGCVCLQNNVNKLSPTYFSLS